jgi:hypothetical protein
MPKARSALQWRVIRGRHKGYRLLPSQFPAQGKQRFAVTYNGKRSTVRQQASDQRQGTLEVPKPHGADRKKNAGRPSARLLAAFGPAQPPLTC